MQKWLKVVLLGLLVVSFASADVVHIELNHEYSGGAAPAGSNLPWLTATFTDVAGGVQLVMSTANLVASEFVSRWYFNLNPILNLSSLNIGHLGGQNAAVAKSSNGYLAAGGGSYDIRFVFPVAASSDRFRAGETSSFLLSGIPGLKASDFLFPSAPRGGNDTYLSTAHVQGIGANANGSGWVGVRIPEATFAGEFALALGACLLLSGARRFRRSGV